MENNANCTNKGMALSILSTVTAAMANGVQKDALKAVLEWIEKNTHDDVTLLTPEQRSARIIELMTKERDRMTVEERQERADFYLKGTAL